MRGSESLSLVCKGDGVVHIMDHQAGCVRLVEQTVAVVGQPPAQWQRVKGRLDGKRLDNRYLTVGHAHLIKSMANFWQFSLNTS